MQSLMEESGEAVGEAVVHAFMHIWGMKFVSHKYIEYVNRKDSIPVAVIIVGIVASQSSETA